MVAIVSGARLGLELSSLHTLGAAGVLGSAAEGRNQQSVAVNAATGNLVVQNRDDVLAARGDDALTLRTYNSRGLLDDDNGDNWSVGTSCLTLTGTLNAAGSTLTRRAFDGSSAVYQFGASGAYVSTEGAGAYDTLTWIAGESQFEWRDGATGATQRFEGGAAMRLLVARDREQNTLVYAYGGNGRLQSVTTSGGEGMRYDYLDAARPERLTQVRTVAGGTTTRVVRYEYDADNRLGGVVLDLSPADGSIADGDVYRTTYTYDDRIDAGGARIASRRVATIAQSDGTRLAIGYDDAGTGVFMVASVTDALNQTTRFQYTRGAAGLATATAITDALGQVTRLTFDAAGQLLSVSSPAVQGVTATRQFTYNARGDVTMVADGEGRTTTFEYDPASGSQTLQRDASGNTVARAYTADNQLLAETVFLSADPDGAGPAVPSGALTTRYVYEGGTRNLLRFVVSAEGRVTEHRYDGFGQRISTIRHGGGTYPVAGLAAASVPSVAAMQAWVSTLDARRGQRVDMAYDGRGMLLARTTFARVDAAGLGVADGSQGVESFIHDAAGQLLAVISPTSGVTSHVYDGLGRPLATTDALGRSTVSQYSDGGSRTTVTLAGGLVTTSAYDAAGRLVSVTPSGAGVALGTTTYAYDALGRLRMTQDPTGVRSWVLYDAAGRKAADIDGNGSVIEYRYDRSDRLVYSVAYATAVSTSLLVTPAGAAILGATLDAGVRPPASTADVETWYRYDAAGRLAWLVKGVGSARQAAVTAYVHDAASRLVRQVQYANTIIGDPSQWPGAMPSPLADAAQDRVTRRFHDAEGRLLATLDAAGYLVESEFNALGLEVRRTAYANATDPARRAAGSLADLRPAASPASDASSFFFHDGKGQLAAEVDAEGYLTEHVYDASGNETTTVRYARVARGPVSVGSAIADLRPVTDPEDRLTSRTYDAMNRLLTEQAPNGLLTRFVYDAEGRVLSKTAAPGTTETREFRARHDLQGRLLAELSAEGSARLTPGLTPAQVEAVWQQFGTWHAYDAAGRRVSTRDALGNTTRFFYNEDSALTYTVNALGEVRENQYDALGRLVREIAYATRIDVPGPGGLRTTSLPVVSDPARDAVTTYAYGRDGQLTARREADGLDTSWTRNSFGDEVASQDLLVPGMTRFSTYQVDARGRRTVTTTVGGSANTVTTWVYDAFGRVVEQRNNAGQVVRHTYDRLGREVILVDATGAQRSTSFDAFSRQLTERDASGNVTTYAYNRAERGVTVRTAEGVTTRTWSNGHGQTIAVTDGNGQGTHYLYAPDGALVRETTSLGSSSRTLDAAGRAMSSVDARGVRTSYGYDAAGRVLTRTVDPGGLNLTTTYAYDALGRQVSVTDPNNVTTRIAFDRKGRTLTRTVDPGGLNLVTTFTHDAEGKVLTVTRPDGIVTETVYDGLGRRIEEWQGPRSMGLRRQWTYDAAGNVAASIDELGAATRYAYDAENRLVFTVDPTGGVRKMEYDADGRVVASTAFAKKINVSAPVLSVASVQAAVVADPARDALERRVYDRDGRVAYTSNALGAVVAFSYDGKGNVVRQVTYGRTIAPASWTPAAVQAALGAADPARDIVVTSTYDAADRLLWRVDGTGAVTRRIYDGNGNEVMHVAYASAATPGSFATSSPATDRDQITMRMYDAANRQVFLLDRAQAVTEQVFDAGGRVTRRIAYASTLASVPLLGEGALAAVRAALRKDSAADRVEHHVYDKANREILTVDAEGSAVSSAWDTGSKLVHRRAFGTRVAAGDVPGVSAPAQSSRDRLTSYRYDAAGRLVFEYDPTGAVRGTTYDRTGRVLNSWRYITRVAAHGDTPVANGADQVESWEYDAAGRVIRAWDAVSKAETYEYDGIGRRVSLQGRGGGVWRYDLDAAGHVVQETSPKVLLTSTTAPAGEVVGAVTAGPTVDEEVITAMAYDAFGRLTQRVEAYGRPEQRVTTYAYDAAGHQVRSSLHTVGVYNPADDLPTLNGATRVAANRKETDRALETVTLYDSLGQAYANRDAAGAWSRKVYDAAGRVSYDIDALGYVTSYTHDAFGQVTSLTRHAVAVAALKLAAGASVVPPKTVTQVAALLGTGSTDRRIVTQYDRAGRVTATIQPKAYVHTSAGASFEASATVRMAYNAFGEAVEVRTPLDASESQNATTYRYYNNAGREVATIDALGHVTHREFNAFGNMVYEREYATPMQPGSWTVEGFGNVPDTAQDRERRYVYDAMNRKVQETRVDVEFSPGPDGSSVRGNLATYYQFDPAGNQTMVIDALGQTTYTEYDLLGRVTGTARPGMSEGVALTKFLRDGLGNAVVQRDYAFGAAVADASPTFVVSLRPSALTSADRITTTRYNALGKPTDVTDAEGKTSYFSYDAAGNVAKSWRAVTDAEGCVRTVFQINVYDALGQLVETRAPASTSVVKGGLNTAFTPGTAENAWRSTLALSWSSLIDPAAGSVQVHVDHVRSYTPPSEEYGYVPQQVTERRTETHTYAAASVAGGVAVTWQLPAGARDELTYITITQLVNGAYVTKWEGTPGQANGSGFVELTQAEAGLVVTRQEFNAFGELVGKGVQGALQEYFDHDNAGRLWRTNTGDGVDRIRLYDRQGNVTSELRSNGFQNLSLYDVAQADTDGALRRVDTTYDALGHVTSRTEAARSDPTGGVIAMAQAQFTSATVLQSATAQNLWTTPNQVWLQWNDLALLGSGDIRVSFNYRTPLEAPQGDDPNFTGAEERSYVSQVLDGERCARGCTLTLPQTQEAIGVVSWIKVEKMDARGFWKTVIDQAPGVGPAEIVVTAPDDLNAYVMLETQVAGTTAWVQREIVNFGDRYRLDPLTLPLGTQAYRVRVFPLGKAEFVAAQGTVEAYLPVLPDIPISTIPAGLYWEHQDERVLQEFRYRVSGTAEWKTAQVRGYGTIDWVNFIEIGSGTYDFELFWRIPGQTPRRACGWLRYPAGGMEVTSYWFPREISGRSTLQIRQPIASTAAASALRPVTYQKADRWGNVTERSDARSAAWITTYRYNDRNQVVRQEQPLTGGARPVTTIHYDALGRQVAVRDALGRVNGMAYDGQGNLRTELHADTGVVTHQYNIFGEKVLSVDAEGRSVTFSYDRLGRLLAQGKGGPNGVIVYGVQSGLNATNMLVGYGHQILYDRWTYDELGQKLFQANGAGQTLVYRYDLRGNVVSALQAAGGEMTQWAFDALGRKVAEVQGKKHGETSSSLVEARWTYDYFGRLTGHTDLGGITYGYSYDFARQLVAQTSARGQNLSYAYDTAGQVIRITDAKMAKVTDYRYDAGGRRVRETVTQEGRRYQDNHLAYDELGRLRVAQDARVLVWMDYDLVGNRTYVGNNVNYQGAAAEYRSSVGRFFQYDAMNRQTVVDALDAQGNIGPTQGHHITYDRNGNRKTDTSYGVRIAPASGIIATHDIEGRAVYDPAADGLMYTRTSGLTTEVYDYDRLNRLRSVERDGVQIDLRFYDGADRVLQSGSDNMPANYRAQLNTSDGRELRINRYDPNGRLQHQTVKNHMGAISQEISWDKNEILGSYIAGGYDAAGNVLGYVVHDVVSGTRLKYDNSLDRYDQYQAAATTVTAEGRPTGVLSQTFDANGYLVRVIDTAAPANNRYFVNDASGKALYVEQNGFIQRQMIVSDEVLGVYGAGPTSTANGAPVFGNVNDFDFGYAPVSGTYPSPTPGAYVVRTGDTLQSIAQSAYGDSKLWYRIAEANGLGSSTDLKVGQTLNIPNRVGTVHNDSTTFKPYDPSKVTGDLTPTLPMPMPVPMPMPANDKGCGGVGKLLMIVVAVAVTVMTGVGGGAIGNFWTGVFGKATLAAAVATGATAAAAGAVAGQAVGLATGTVRKFDWKSVALSAVSGGVVAGLPTNVFGLSGAANVIARAAVASVATQGVAVATGLQRHFSWRTVAASAVGAGVGSSVGEALDLPANSTRPASMDWGEFVAKSAVKAFAAGGMAAVARGGRVAVQQVAADAFGNALGQSLAAASTSSAGAFGVGEAARRVGIDDNGDHVSYAPAKHLEDVSDIVAAVNGAPEMDTSRDVLLAESRLRLSNPVGDTPTTNNVLNALEAEQRERDLGTRQRTLANQEDLNTATRLLNELRGSGAPHKTSAAQIERGLRQIEDLAEAHRASGLSGATGDAIEFIPSSDQGSGLGLRVSSRVGFNLQTVAEGANPNGGAIDQFVRGFSSQGSDWSVLEGEKPLAYSFGSAARSGVGLIYDGLTGAGDFRAAGQAFDQGRYVEGTMYGLRGIGSAGMTALTLGDFALARASVQGAGLRLTATETGSSSGINPRLQQRLDAWRDYQARGGQYDMHRWVQSTQGAPWATGFQSGYGKWINSVESVHGNSLLSKQPATLYQLYTDEGDFLKWGISQSMNTRYSGTFMADKQIFRYAEGSRANMLRLEREMVQTQPGPLNFEPWAGRRKP